MTEQAPQGPEPSDVDVSDAGDSDRAEPTHTGVPRVDAVLADIAGVDDLPLAEHAAAFERAHESLRAALDEAPDHDGSEHPADASGDPA
jgi:hypothetical protein